MISSEEEQVIWKSGKHWKLQELVWSDTYTLKKAHTAFPKEEKRQMKLQLRFDLGNTFKYKLKILQ